jgi:translation initiation factor IF-3
MISLVAFRSTSSASLVRLAAVHKCSIRLPTLRVCYATQPGSDRPRDRDIPHSIVHVADEDGLGPPTALSHLLASIDIKSHFIQLVAETPKPIVKIIDKKENYEKRKQRQKRRKEALASNVQKEIQMTWNIEPGDMAHKLKKIQKEVEKGTRIELVFAPKVNQRAPNPALMETRINETAEKIAEFAREWLPRKVDRGVAIFYLKQLDRTSKPKEPS